MRGRKENEKLHNGVMLWWSTNENKIIWRGKLIVWIELDLERCNRSCWMKTNKKKGFDERHTILMIIFTYDEKEEIFFLFLNICCMCCCFKQKDLYLFMPWQVCQMRPFVILGEATISIFWILWKSFSSVSHMMWYFSIHCKVPLAAAGESCRIRVSYAHMAACLWILTHKLTYVKFFLFFLPRIRCLVSSTFNSFSLIPCHHTTSYRTVSLSPLISSFHLHSLPQND